MVKESLCSLQNDRCLTDAYQNPDSNTTSIFCKVILGNDEVMLFIQWLRDNAVGASN